MATVWELLRESDNSSLIKVDDAGLLTVLGSLSTNGGTNSTSRRILKNITAAQLKAIKATPIEIIPAPGAGLANIITQIAYYYRFVTSAFTLNAGALRLFQGAVANNIPVHADVAAGLIDAVANRTILQPPQLKQGPASDATLVNQNVTLANDGAAEFTVGLGNLDVFVSYGIHTL
jgi:hypothetical protein